MKIFIALLLMDALLLWAVIYARGKWQLKVATMAVVLGFNFVVVSSLSSYKGWPTPSTPPKDALFLQATVNEPDPLTHDPGSIYLWLIPTRFNGGLLGYQRTGNEPRAYKLPYSEQLYKQVLQAQQLQKKGHGQPVAVHSSGRHGRRGHGHSNAPWSMHSYLLPTPHPPRKVGD